MAQDDPNFYAGHRKRMEDKFFDGKISHAEYVELLLMSWIRRRDVRKEARALMAKYGGIHQICAAPIEELMQIPGIGKTVAKNLKLMNHGWLLGYHEHLDTRPIFHNMNILTNYCLTTMAVKMVEEFHVLYLGPDMRLLLDQTHCVGTIDQAAVYPREILRTALNLNAKYIILMHNHPTAGAPFSSDDIEITKQVRRILAPADIILHDHLLVSGGQLLSAKNKMLLV